VALKDLGSGAQEAVPEAALVNTLRARLAPVPS